MKTYETTSHEAFGHDSLDSLAYDWERVANPQIAPKRPLHVVLPESTEEVARVVSELRQLDKPFVVRSKGHSSNDLVLAERGTVICTEFLSRILSFDGKAETVRVQSGAVLADIDDFLAEHGCGLPIIGDHNHITAGGFASVGGISPASHRHGMFVDNVTEIQYVTPTGGVRTCSREQGAEEFFAVLAGLGKFGVVTELVCRTIRIHKQSTILKNSLMVTRSLDEYIERSGEHIRSPGDAVMERGVWLNLPALGKELNIGQFSVYREVRQSPAVSMANRAAYGVLHGLGSVAGRLPQTIDEMVKYLGMAGIIFSPPYASVKNVERFTDKVLDSSVGDPTRMFIVLAPVGEYPALFRELYSLCRQFREQTHCFSFLSIYVKAIRSPYLAQGSGEEHFCELMLYAGVRPEGMTPQVVENLASAIDDLCIRRGAFRYMHTRTVKDEARRRRVDPNTHYADRLGSSSGAQASVGAA